MTDKTQTKLKSDYQKALEAETDDLLSQLDCTIDFEDACMIIDGKSVPMNISSKELQKIHNKE